MQYLTTENLKKFDALEQLEQKMHETHNKWLTEVRKQQRNNQPIDNTRQLFEEYLETYREWKNYFDQHKNIFLAETL